MGILSSIGNAVEKAEEMLGFDTKEEEKASVEAGAEANNGAELQNDTASAAGYEAATGSAQTYTVQSGDTLSKISERYYGNTHDYMKIFNANRDKLNDPDEIQVGQELTIPAE